MKELDQHVNFTQSAALPKACQDDLATDLHSREKSSSHQPHRFDHLSAQSVEQIITHAITLSDTCTSLAREEAHIVRFQRALDHLQSSLKSAGLVDACLKPALAMSPGRPDTSHLHQWGKLVPEGMGFGAFMVWLASQSFDPVDSANTNQQLLGELVLALDDAVFDCLGTSITVSDGINNQGASAQIQALADARAVQSVFNAFESVGLTESVLLQRLRTCQIIADFSGEVWINNVAMPASDGSFPINVTGEVLLLDLYEIHKLEDEYYTSDALTDDLSNWDGPSETSVTESICNYFSVDELVDITQDMLDAARRQHHSLLRTAG